jgi:hypothetical protein
MQISKSIVLALALLPAGIALGRGVSPYLPLALEPEIERQIERVLILADKPVLARPIALATVRDALPAACARDRQLCERVARYISQYTRSTAVTHLAVEAASNSGAELALANRHGLTSESAWAASARLHWQPFDHALISAGGVAYEGKTTATGSLLSLGWDRAQLDVGFREHQLSPFTDSAMLIGTHAPAMPSVTLSNYLPLTRLGIRYEVFLAEMSESDRIVFNRTFTTGKPRLSGTHVSIEPVPGFSLGVNRLLQFGGGVRGGTSLGDFARAFWNPSRFDNADQSLPFDEQFGNQLASYTSRLIYPGRTPFAIYMEYAGEDTSRGRNHLLGNSALSVGLDFPRLPFGLDATIEVSDWQNAWYVNSVYGDGLTNDERGIGHWLVDRRRAGDAVDGNSQSLRIGWQPRFGGEFELRWRTLQNDDYTGGNYQRSREVGIKYSRPVGAFRVGADWQFGSDVFGEDTSRIAAFFRYTGESSGSLAWLEEEQLDNGDDPTGAHVFVNVGATLGFAQIEVDRDVQVETDFRWSPHLALGVRRAVGEKSDIGARIEFDEIENRALVGVRAVDYRYRASERFAYSGFLGAARYDLGTSAYGIYLGIGAEWRDVLPGWSVGLDLKYASKVARDRLLPEDQGAFVRDAVFYDIASATVAITRRF